MTKKQVLGILALLAVSYAFGRYSAPEKIKTETKIVEIEKKTIDKQTKTAVDTKKHTTIIETKLPSGATTTTTVIDESKDLGRTTKSDTVDDTSKNTDTVKEITKSSGHTNLYLLGGIDVKNPSNGLTYGLGVSRSILGPISIGFVGLTNGNASATIGLEL